MRIYSLACARKVVDLLGKKEVRQALREVHGQILAAAIGVAYDDPADHDSPETAWDEESRIEAAAVEAGTLAPARSEVVRFHFGLYENEIRDALAIHVVERLARPGLIELADLMQEFFATMRILPDAFDSAYEVFVGNIEHCVLTVRSTTPFAIGEVPCFEVFEQSEDAESASEQGTARLIGEAVASDDEEEEAGSPAIIWKSNGVVVELLGEAPAALDNERSVPPDAWHDVRCIYAKIAGVMSESACGQVLRELRQVLPSIVRSVSLLVPRRLSNEPATGLPWITVELLQRHLGFTRSCLNSYYASPTKKIPLNAEYGTRSTCWGKRTSRPTMLLASRCASQQ